MAISQGSVFGIFTALIFVALAALAILGVAILGHILVFVWNHLAITAGIIILIGVGIWFIAKKC